MNVEILERQPAREDGPVFDAPWQARTFAMAVKLHEAGVFSWSQWSTMLSENIRAVEKQSQLVKSSDDYYRIWQQTLEEITAIATDAD